jgi:hypothetical protein
MSRGSHATSIAAADAELLTGFDREPELLWLRHRSTAGFVVSRSTKVSSGNRLSYLGALTCVGLMAPA